MKKIFIFVLILSQAAVVPSWSMGRRMKEPNTNQVREQSQTGQNGNTKLDDSGNLDTSGQTFKDQDRDTMNSTTGFSGQTSPAENVESDMDMKNQSDASNSVEPPSLNTKGQSNISGSPGTKSPNLSGPKSPGIGSSSQESGSVSSY